MTPGVSLRDHARATLAAERRFFAWLSFAILTFAVMGFTRTYFLVPNLYMHSARWLAFSRRLIGVTA